MYKLIQFLNEQINLLCIYCRDGVPMATLSELANPDEDGIIKCHSIKSGINEGALPYCSAWRLRFVKDSL
jgi:hypothetical protein